MKPLLLGVATIQPGVVQTKTQRSNADFSRTCRCEHRQPYPQSETALTVSFVTTNNFNTNVIGWSNGTTNGVFNMTIDTRAIPAGTYVLLVTFSRLNYKNLSQEITLTVASFQPSISMPTLVSVTENSGAVIQFSVTDALLHQEFDAIDIEWVMEGTALRGHITQVDPSGNYSITFPTSDLVASKDYNLQVTVQVTIDGVVYSTTFAQPAIVRVEYANIFGIPRPYFWLLVAVIAVAAGGFIVYSGIKRARIPLFLKKIASIRKNIKSKRVSANIVPAPTRAEIIAEMSANNLAIFGLGTRNFNAQRKNEAAKLAHKNTSPSNDDEQPEVQP